MSYSYGSVYKSVQLLISFFVLKFVWEKCFISFSILMRCHLLHLRYKKSFWSKFSDSMKKTYIKKHIELLYALFDNTFRVSLTKKKYNHFSARFSFIHKIVNLKKITACDCRPNWESNHKSYQQKKIIQKISFIF